ncbi:MAG: BON domain-containing protein [Proteobacteria bacterium]|nr:BON domain-containing protein [Pseudomonadota bacterium]
MQLRIRARGLDVLAKTRHAVERRVSVLVLVFALAAASAASGQTQSPEDDALRARIEAQLAELIDGTGASIRVAVRDGQVVLQGQVRLLEQSLRAEQAAWTTPGVRDVDNELRVVPLAAGTDAAIARQVRMIVKSDGRFLDTQLRIEVLAGVVSIRGAFQDPGDVLALKHRVAAIPGVLDVEIDALLVAGRTSANDKS